MTTTEVKGNWKELKGKLKQKIGILTRNSQMVEKGRQEELFGQIQIRFGKSKEDWNKMISGF
jgi:uncharacterized protein YjbJ (UPF0337 family)